MVLYHHKLFLTITIFHGAITVLANFDFHLLHVNDIHARFEETNKYSGRCKPEDAGNLIKVSLQRGKRGIQKMVIWGDFQGLIGVKREVKNLE